MIWVEKIVKQYMVYFSDLSVNRWYYRWKLVHPHGCRHCLCDKRDLLCLLHSCRKKDQLWAQVGYKIIWILSLHPYLFQNLINFRWRYIRAVLRQDTAWYDKQNVECIPTIIHKNLREVEVASGRTVAFILYSLGCGMSGIGINFGAGWIFWFSLIGLPVYCIVFSAFAETSFAKWQAVGEEAYLKGGIQAEESLNAIKIVKAFGQEGKCTKDFDSHLQKKHEKIMGMAWLYGSAFGAIETFSYVSIAYPLLIGGFFISEKVSLSII